MRRGKSPTPAPGIRGRNCERAQFRGVTSVYEHTTEDRGAKLRTAGSGVHSHRVASCDADDGRSAGSLHRGSGVHAQDGSRRSGRDPGQRDACVPVCPRVLDRRVACRRSSSGDREHESRRAPGRARRRDRGTAGRYLCRDHCGSRGRRSPLRGRIAAGTGTRRSGGRPGRIRIVRTTPRCGCLGRRCTDRGGSRRAARSAPRTSKTDRRRGDAFGGSSVGCGSEREYTGPGVAHRYRSTRGLLPRGSSVPARREFFSRPTSTRCVRRHAGPQPAAGAPLTRTPTGPVALAARRRAV